jgi:flagellar basal body-associated protein FliL
MKLFSTYRLVFRSMLFAGLCAGFAANVQASTHAAEEPEETEEATEETEGIEVTLKLNLGAIELQNLEPTQGRTAHMSFDLHLRFDPKTDPKFLKELEGWQHRLREQVIVAVRATDIFDFLDPELKRFRKQILYRINRMLKEPVVIDALFANFTFSSQ